MNIGTRNLRFKLGLTAAASALMLTSGIANAQLGELVRDAHLYSNSGGITVTDTSSDTTDISVTAPTVVANWTQFNVPTATTLNVTNGSSAAIATLLNRVIGAPDPLNFSDISGVVNAIDVNLWLLNQNGIFFGDGATINANSFFASTLDVDDQDFFDYYGGTNVFGNGTDLINFSGGIGGSITSDPGGISFTTDGTLLFASEEFNIEGAFDARSGRAAFIAAADLDVQFDAGSPLSYTLNQGTTVASQRVGGSAVGSGVDFQFMSAVNVVDAMLTIDADVTANAAQATDSGIRLFANRNGGTRPSVVINGALNSTGEISGEVGVDLTINADIKGSSIELDVGRNLIAQNITARGGDLSLTAQNNINTGDLRGQNIRTQSITRSTTTGNQIASGNISGVSARGYTSGFMRARNGNLTVTAENNVTIDGFNSGSTARVTSNTADIVFGGNATSGGSMILSTPMGSVYGETGGNLKLESGNDLIADNIVSRDGDLILRADSDIKTGALTAKDDIRTESRTGVTKISGSQSAGGSIIATSGGSYESGFMRTTNGDIAVTSENRATIDGFNSAAEASIMSVRGDIVLTGNGRSGDSMLLRTIRGRVIGDTGGNLLLQSDTDLTTNSVSSEANLTLSAGTDLQTGDLRSGGNIRTTSMTGSTNTGNQIAQGSIIGSAGTTYSSRFMRTFDGNIVVNSGDTASIRGFNSAGQTRVTADTGDVLITDRGISTGTTRLTAMSGSVDAKGLSATNNDADLVLTAAENVNTNNLFAGRNIATTSTAGLTNVRTQNAGGTVTGISGTTYRSDRITSGGNLLVTAGETAWVGGYNIGGDATVTSDSGAVILTDDAVSVGAATLIAMDGNVNTQGVRTTGNGSEINISAMNGAASTGFLRTDGINSDIQLNARNTTAVDGFDSSGMASVTSTNGNVVVTADAQSEGAMTLEAALGHVIATQDGTLSGTGVNLTTIGDGAEIDIDAAKRLVSGNLTATGLGSNISVNADNGITAGDLTSNNDTTLVTTGSVVAGETMVGGQLMITGSDPNSDNLNDGSATIQNASLGNVTGASVVINSAGSIIADNVHATTGNIDLDSTDGGEITLGDLTAATSISVDSSGSISAQSADAGGALSVGTNVSAGDITFSGDIEAASVDMFAANDISLQNVDASIGNIGIRSSFGGVDYVSMEGETNVALYAKKDIAGGNITSNTGNIDLDSTDGGEITLGDLTAATSISVDSSGSISAQSADAGGALSVGTNVRAGDITFSGDIEAASVDMFAARDISLQNVDASIGNIGIRSSFGGIDYVSMEGETNVALYAKKDIAGGNITSNTGNIDTDSIGNTSVGSQNAGGTITGRSRGTYASGAMTSGGNMEVVSGGTITVAGYNSGGSTLLRSNSGNVNLTANSMSTGNTTLTGINITGQSLMSGGDITTNSTERTIFGGRQNAVGAITARAGTNYRSERMTSGGALSVEAENNARINGFRSGGAARVESNSNNVILTANSSSVGGMTLTAGAGSVIATENGTLGGDGVRLSTSGDNAALSIMANRSVATGVIITTGLASNVDIDAGQNVDTNLIRTDFGDIDVDAGQTATIAGFNSGGTASITADRGDVILTANARSVGDMALESLQRHVIATADGTLSGTGVSLRTAGPNADISVNADDAVRIGRITANGDLTVGTRGGAPVDRATFTDSISANNVDIYASNAVDTLSVNATTGDINIESVSGSVSTTTQTARGSITGSAGTTFTSHMLTTRTGNINVGADDNVLVAGFDSANMANIASDSGNVTISVAGESGGDTNLMSEGSIDTQNLTAGGNIDLDSGNTLTTLALDAGGNILTDSVGATTITTQMAGGSIMGTSGSTYNSGAMSTDSGDINVSAVSNIEIAGFDSGANTSIASSGGNVVVSAAGLSGGDTSLMTSGSMNTQNLNAGGNINLDSGDTLTTLALDAGGNIVTDSVGTTTITTQMAGGSIMGTSGSNYNSGAMSTDNGDINVGAVSNIEIAGFDSGANTSIASSGGNIVVSAAGLSAGDTSLMTSGSMNTQNLTAGGNIDLDSGDSIGTLVLDAGGNIITNSTTSTSTGTQTAGGFISGTAGTTFNSGMMETTGAGDITVLASNAVTIDGIKSGGEIDIDSTEGGNLNVGDLDAAGTISLDTTGNLLAGQITGGGLNIGSVSPVSEIEWNTAVSSTSVTVSATGDITTQNITATNGAIDIDSTEGGDLDLGNLSATTDIDLDTTGSIDIGLTSAGGSLNIGTNRTASEVTFDDNVTAANMTVMADGMFTSNAAVDAGAFANITSGDIDLADGSSLTADMVALMVGSTGDVILGTGTGDYILDNSEHARIITPEFSLYAGANNVQINDLTYSGATGSNSVSVLSDGMIMFLGDVTGDGAGRVFRYAGGAGAGSASEAGLAVAIIGNSNDATLNYGQATLDFRANDIIFGNQGFIDQVLGLTSGEIAGSFVGNASSALYNAILTGGISAERETNPVYLIAGNLDVSYENSALFQNTGLVSTGISQTTGINIGGEGGAGILRLMPTDLDNTFGYFGLINGLEGRAAALSGPDVVIVNGELDITSSRINGCLIGSAAGCISARFDTLLVEIPEDGSTLIEADGSLLVPFDPLSGTNNEGLFSDAASNFDEENCERDNSGACVSETGDE